ncbi:MAG: lyase family protein, partial [Chitinophagaceae bacterium]
MELNTLTAISPIDGRYRKQVHHLEDYFSEYALMKYRVMVEIEYFLFLSDKKFFDLGAKSKKLLKAVADNFSIEDAKQIKETEKITNHDVKAVEYFLKSKLEECGAEEGNEWIHFGLTSQDINNTSIPLAWKHAIEIEYLPLVLNLNQQLQLLAQQW